MVDRHDPDAVGLLHDGEIDRERGASAERVGGKDETSQDRCVAPLDGCPPAATVAGVELAMLGEQASGSKMKLPEFQR